MVTGVMWHAKRLRVPHTPLHFLAPVPDIAAARRALVNSPGERAGVKGRPPGNAESAFGREQALGQTPGGAAARLNHLRFCVLAVAADSFCGV